MKSGALAVAAIAAAAAAPTLANGFVYDDVLVIQQNPLVQGLGHSATLWSGSYWPNGLLYRPLTLQLFAVEWGAGGGSPFLFHAVSVLLSAIVAWLLFRLLQVLLRPDSAEQPGNPWHRWIPIAGATLFALHPVHVETVANIVGQSELLAALFALLAVERYLEWRQSDGLTLQRRLLLALLTLLAILSKETGYVAPLFLLAAELTLLRRARRTGVAATFLLQAGVVVGALLLRAAVLGSLAGETPSTVFRGLGAVDRAVAMLAAVPQWARLLFWPAHLQAEYGPPTLPLTPTLTTAHLAGALILVLGIATALWSWRRRPILAFGLLWTGIALAPVSNLAAPTGIVLAERVLFLPSAGIIIAAAGFAAAVADRSTRASRIAFGIMTVGVLHLAAVRTLTRQPVWRSQESFFTALTRDAPRSYRAHFVASRYWYGERRYAEAEADARTALALYDRDVQVHEQLGQVLRVQGRCREALPVLAEGVTLAPEGTTVRSRLIECALAVGDTARARDAASAAVRLGQPEFEATLRRLSPAP